MTNGLENLEVLYDVYNRHYDEDQITCLIKWKKEKEPVNFKELNKHLNIYFDSNEKLNTEAHWSFDKENIKENKAIYTFESIPALDNDSRKYGHPKHFYQIKVVPRFKTK